MAYRILLVDLEYSTALKIKRMVPWKAYDYTLLMEFVDVTGLEKVKLLEPDILILGELRFFNGIKTYLDLIESNGLATKVIILCDSEEEMERWRDQKHVNAVLNRSTLDAEILTQTLRRAEWQNEASAISLPDSQYVSDSLEGDRAVLREFMATMIGSSLTGYIHLVRAVRENAFREGNKKVIEECIVNALRENENIRWFVGSDNNLYILTYDRAFYNNMISLKMLSKPLQNLVISLGAQLECSLTLFVSENIEKDAFPDKFEKMRKLGEYYYFLADMAIVPEDKVRVRNEEGDFDTVRESVTRMTVEALKGNVEKVESIVDYLYFERLKYSMDYNMLYFARDCIRRAAWILSFAVEGVFEEILLERHNTLEEEAEYLSNWLGEINEKREMKVMNELIVQTVLVVNERYMQTVTLSDVAQELNISKYYLSRLFKENMGIGFVEYLNDVRIEYAKKCMLEGERSVREVAQKTGFTDTKYFSKVFKDITGKKPSEYIQEVVARRMEML